MQLTEQHLKLIKYAAFSDLDFSWACVISHWGSVRLSAASLFLVTDKALYLENICCCYIPLPKCFLC